MTAETKQQLEDLAAEAVAGMTDYGRRNMTSLDELVEGSKLQRFVGHGSLLVIWRGGSTFNVHNATTLEEVDVFTVYGDDKGNPITSIEEAARAVDSWYEQLDDGYSW